MRRANKNFILFSIFSLILVLILEGCGNSNALPPIESLVSRFTESIKVGDKENLSKCFVRFEEPLQGRPPAEVFEQQSRKQYFLGIINDLFPTEGTQHKSVDLKDYQFSKAELLSGTLVIIKESDEMITLETEMIVRMSISGWKIASITIKQI